MSKLKHRTVLVKDLKEPSSLLGPNELNCLKLQEEAFKKGILLLIDPNEEYGKKPFVKKQTTKFQGKVDK